RRVHKPHFWLTNKTKAPTAINNAIRTPTTNETAGCRLRLTSSDSSPFCAAPRPNQKRSLSIDPYPVRSLLVGPQGLCDERLAGGRVSGGNGSGLRIPLSCAFAVPYTHVRTAHKVSAAFVTASGATLMTPDPGAPLGTTHQLGRPCGG